MTKIRLFDSSEVEVTERSHHGPHAQGTWPRITLSRDNGATAVAVSFDLESRTHVDEMIGALRPYSTSPDPLTDYTTTRAALCAALGTTRPTHETNAELAKRCGDIMQGLARREKQAEKRAQEELIKRGAAEQVVKEIETTLCTSTLPRDLTVRQAVQQLIADRARAEKALAGQ